MLPKRPPKLIEVAAVVAVMAAITMWFAWQKKHDERPAAITTTTLAAPVITQTLPGGVVATQPLVSFRVYVGCGETPDEVRVGGVSAQMPISLFDHNSFPLQVVAEGVTADVTVFADGNNDLQVLSGDALAYYTALYVTVGQRKYCPPGSMPQH